MIKNIIKVSILSVALIGSQASLASNLKPKRFSADTSSAEVMTAAMSYANFWNTGNKEFAIKALSPSFEDMTPPAGRKPGIDGVLEASANFRKAVPDLHVSVEHLLISGDYATVRYRFQGTFTGVMGSKKGYGQKVDFPAVDIYEVYNGKIMKNWHLEDYQTLFEQIGNQKYNHR